MSDSAVASIASSAAPPRLITQLASELAARPAQIAAAVALLDDGATVPFIARYRKEATGGLDDTVLRALDVRLDYLRELDARRAAVLASIAEQGKLDDALREAIDAADTKQRLEDLYAPYKPKRRTRAQIAREAGLEPLADAILSDPNCDPAALAAGYLNPDANIADTKSALDGARDILAERFAENADLLADMRAWLAARGHDVRALIAVVSADNLAAGLASAAFIAYLSALTNVQYSATQYALFSSVMLLLPKWLGGFSGTFVDAWGYPAFFTATALLGVPVLVLIVLAARFQRL